MLQEFDLLSDRNAKGEGAMTFTLPEQELLQAVNDAVLESFDEKSLKILRKAVELRQKILLEYLSITGKNTAIHKKQLIKSVKKSDRKWFS